MTSDTTAGPPRGGSAAAKRMRAVADAISTALNVIGTLLILGLVVLVNADVLGRELFLAPISGVPEIVSMSIVAIVFLQVSQAFRMGRFTRTDTFLDLLERVSPRIRSAVDLLYSLAALALIWFIFSASLPLFEKSWERGTYLGTVGDFTAPEWPVKLVILVGCAALMVQIAIQAIIALRNLAYPEPAAGAGE